jgi:hypothetical protein
MFTDQVITIMEVNIYTFVKGWVLNLVSHFEGGTYSEGLWKQSAEEDIWT